MSSKSKTILFALLLLLVLGSAYWAYSVLSEQYQTPVQDTAGSSSDTLLTFSEQKETEKNTAPDFIVYNAVGNQVKLSDFFGKPIVLNFWASWCPPCKSEMPHFNEVYLAYKEDVVFLMVDMVDGIRETQIKGRTYIEEAGYSFPVYFDNDQQASEAYNVLYLPTTVFINKHGNIENQYQGAISKTTLEAGIKALLDS